MSRPTGNWPEGDLWRAYMARTEPGNGRLSDDAQQVPGSSNVKFKSIPGAPTGRLLRRVEYMHPSLHTTDGLSAHDGPRRDLINQGVKLRAITHELRLRGVVSGECFFCWGS